MAYKSNNSLASGSSQSNSPPDSPYGSQYLVMEQGIVICFQLSGRMHLGGACVVALGGQWLLPGGCIVRGCLVALGGIASHERFYVMCMNYRQKKECDFDFYVWKLKWITWMVDAL